MGFTKVMTFGELVEKLAQNNCISSICDLLDIRASQNERTDLSIGRIPLTLMYRFSRTWWEVSWPKGSKVNVVNEHARYRHIANNIEGLLRQSRVKYYIA
ncbi:MAG: hypothetical protein K9M75_03340 [Phycisphaerae bacterium]|nr:hypothetical protein [Phycisphaerae bacterium]